MTRAELLDEARLLGTALLQRGLREGSAVAFQLPNWHEACVVNAAAVMYGFKLVPLLPMYREAELRLILRETAPEAIFMPERFRNVSYADIFSRVQQESITSENVYIVRGRDDRYATYQELLSNSQAAAARVSSPDAVKMVLYTSGSTGHPKGVLHTHRSIRHLVDLTASFWDLSARDIALVPSPVAHIGGSLYAFDFPLYLGMTAVLMDSWDPKAAVELIESERVTFCAGATPFLADLLKSSEQLGEFLPSLRRFICGGASVPPALIEQASQRFKNCTVSRAYGSTEVSVICPGVRSRNDQPHGAKTDGEICADIRIVGADGNPVAEGEAGEIVAKAPQMFAGYLRAADNELAFTSDGYFRMGDLGRVVAGKFLEITGRKKDLIIRLGENISPLEVENVLMEHPAIRQVSIVGIPDARTGEAALAFAVLREGARLTLDDVKEFLAARGLAKQKFPEHLRIVDALPTNSTGKVLKRELQRIGLDGAI